MGKKNPNPGLRKQEDRTAKNQAKYQKEHALTPQQEEVKKAMEAPVYKRGVPGHGETLKPSLAPTARPSWFPTLFPSVQPSVHPSERPSSEPSSNPSAQPSRHPSAQPSSRQSATRQPSAQPSIASTLINSRQPTVFLNGSIPCPPGYNRTIIGYENGTNFDDIFSNSTIGNSTLGNSTMGNSTFLNSTNGSIPIYGNCSLIEQPNISRSNQAATNLLPLYAVVGILAGCVVGAICYCIGRSPQKKNKRVAALPIDEKPDSSPVNLGNVIRDVEIQLYDSDSEQNVEAPVKKALQLANREEAIEPLKKTRANKELPRTNRRGDGGQGFF
jgi:hypothetical protein